MYCTYHLQKFTKTKKEHLKSALFTNIKRYVIEHIDNSNPPNEIVPSKPTTNPVKQIQSARQIEDCDNGTNDLLVPEPYCFIFS